ncbi:MAG: TSUP family transporter [Oscillospiraceae bacterium]|nr:TSUP family transporter [Oscillospiraceae bacterium]
MVDSLPVALITGLILGILAGLGVGGGSLLILWLTLVLGTESGIARTINLMFFLTAAGAVSLFRWRKGTLDLKQLLPAIIAGCITAALFSWLRGYIHTELADKLFGILLLGTGLKELFYRPRNAR